MIASIRNSAALAALLLASSSSIVPSANAFVPPSSFSSPSLSFSSQEQHEATTSTSSSTTTSLFAIRRSGGRRQPIKQAEFVPPMNNKIEQTELRVTLANILEGKDEPLGIMSKTEALAKAKELGGLDLILINGNSDPPVCKIVDYSKYRYSLEKKRKEKAKNSKATEVKEVKMSYKIGDHDYGVRLKSASSFLQKGNRVKATVTFRGREVQHDRLGEQLLFKLAEDLEQICLMEKKPKREGRNMLCILTPKAEVTKALNDKKRAMEKEKKKLRAEKLVEKQEADEAKNNPGLDGEDDDEDGVRSLFDGIDMDEFDLDDDDMDSSLDELLGTDKATDDLFS